MVDEGRAPLVSVGEFSVGEAEEEEEDEDDAAERDSAEPDEFCAAAPRASRAAR